MDIRKLQKIAVEALADIKAEDIEVINTSKLTALFDRIIVATGNSNRQTKALARNVHDKVKEAGGHVYGMEGEETGEWVLVDLGDIVVHVMQPAVRAHYNLEELWAAKPVKEKPVGKVGVTKGNPRGTGNTPKARAAAKRDVPAKAPAQRAAAKEAPAKRALSKEAPVKRALSKEAPVKRAAANKTPAKPAATPKPARRRAPAKGGES